MVNTFKAMVEKMFNGAATGDNAAKALPYKRKKDCGERRGSVRKHLCERIGVV